MMQEVQDFVGGVRELDLAKCGTVSVVDTMNLVQGLRTSAAFFTFLRANLALSASTPLSPYPNTPWAAVETPTILTTTSTTTTLYPSSSPLATDPALTPLDDIPAISLEPLQDRDDQDAGLRLVGDSIAQMKQRAINSVIFHPVGMGALITAWAGVYRYAYIPTRDFQSSLLLSCLVTIAYVTAIRYLTHGYTTMADNISSWLEEGDLLIGARRHTIDENDDVNDDIVGVVVLRLEPRFSAGFQNGSKRRNRSMSLRGGKGVIRAWTTDYQHRGQGLGNDLLASAVRIVKERCGKDAEIGFAQEHANSVMLLPSWFNGGFKRDEVRAALALEATLENWEANKKRKR